MNLRSRWLPFTDKPSKILTRIRILQNFEGKSFSYCGIYTYFSDFYYIYYHILKYEII